MLMASFHLGNCTYCQIGPSISHSLVNIPLGICSFGGTDFPVDDFLAACLLVRKILHIIVTCTHVEI